MAATRRNPAASVSQFTHTYPHTFVCATPCPISPLPHTHHALPPLLYSGLEYQEQEVEVKRPPEPLRECRRFAALGLALAAASLGLALAAASLGLALAAASLGLALAAALGLAFAAPLGLALAAPLGLALAAALALALAAALALALTAPLGLALAAAAPAG